MRPVRFDLLIHVERKEELQKVVEFPAFGYTVSIVRGNDEAFLDQEKRTIQIGITEKTVNELPGVLKVQFHNLSDGSLKSGVYVPRGGNESGT